MKTRKATGLVRVVVVIVVSCAAVAVGAVAIWFNRPAVVVTRVIEGPVVQAFYATGTVRPRLEYPINSNAGGIIEKMLVRQGDAVRKDQLLGVVIDPMLAYQAEKSAADLKTRREFADARTSPVLHEFDQRAIAAEQMLHVAEQQEQRLESLAQHNAASANDRDQAHEHAQKLWGDLESIKALRATKARELAEDVEVAEAADRAARENLSRQSLRSPVDGVVLDEPASQGTRVEINGHVMQIADLALGNLVMRAAVDEENIARAAVGQRVKMTLYSFPGTTFDGVVERKYPKADAARRTFDIDVRFTIPEPRLQPGMTGEMAFIEKTLDRALIVPAQAVQSGVIWTIHDGRLTTADATVGIRGIERAEVVWGLGLGDVVVVSPIGELHAGQRVRVGTVLDPKVAADLNKPREVTFKGFQ